MNSLRGPLYLLRATSDVDLTRTALGQQVCRSGTPQKELRRSSSMVLRQQSAGMLRKRDFGQHFSASEGHDWVTKVEPLGNLTHDWKERGFELCHISCELRYQCNRSIIGSNESKHSPGMIALGFVQENTKLSAGPIVQSVDRNQETAEKLRLFTIEIAFEEDRSIFPKFFTIGHPDESERNRWLQAMQEIARRKLQLHCGLQLFYRGHVVSEADKTDEWLKRRSGALDVQLNIAAKRRARLQNGKVIQDVPKVFDRLSEECSDWELDPCEIIELGPGAKKKLLDVSHIVEALSELGLDLSPKVAKRVLDEVRKNPPRQDIPNKVDLTRFELIFRSCCLELLVSPSEEMKQNLMRIMQDSKNPFLNLLSPAEQMYLIEGKDADGRNFCTCKSYTKDTVLVQQGDEGDSMFIVIEGSLSVVVTFGGGTAVVQKEVAVLPAGSVMGEMSLVLGKPRSASCVVKSDSASVAEISRTAMARLLETRPSLARELEDMVHRRDAANYLNAGRTATAMAAYRQRVGREAKPAPRGAAAPAGAGATAEARQPDRASVSPQPAVPRGAGGGSRPPSRIHSRQGNVRRPQTSHGPLPPVSGPGVLHRSASNVNQSFSASGTGNLSWKALGGTAPAGAGPRIKSGRWVKCRGIYVFVVD